MSNLDGQTQSTTPRLKLFNRVTGIASHPEVILEVEHGSKIIGGGAQVSYYGLCDWAKVLIRK